MGASSGGGHGGGGVGRPWLLRATLAFLALAWPNPLPSAQAVTPQSPSDMEVVYNCRPDAPVPPQYKKYFQPFYEGPRRVTEGCASAQLSPEGYQVHVIRLTHPTVSYVTITAVDNDQRRSRGMVLLLDSPTPVRWRLKMSGRDLAASHDLGSSKYELQVFTSESSDLFSWSPRAPDLTDTVESVVGRPGHLAAANRTTTIANQDFFSRVLDRFGAVTTFSQISDANHIIIKLSQDPVTANSKSSALRLPDQCDLLSSGDSDQRHTWPLDPLRPKPAVLAYKVTREPYAGCFHPPTGRRGAIGGSDIYVIDLGSADNDTHTNPDYLPVVDISMKPEATDGRVAERNLTLILVSQSGGIQWNLESRDLSGGIHVIHAGGDGSVVRDKSLSPDHRLTTRRMPKTTDSSGSSSYLDILRTVYQVASPDAGLTAYYKVDLANVFMMVIPERGPPDIANNEVVHGVPSTPLNNSKEKLNIAGFVPESGPIPKDPLSQDNSHGPIVPNKSRSAQWKKGIEYEIDLVRQALSPALTTDCHSSETTVALPVGDLRRHHVTAVTLDEPTCRGVDNTTHLVLTILGTSCGSINSITNGNPRMDNNVNLQFSEGSSLYQVPVRLPFHCTFNSNPFGPIFEDDEDGSPDGGQLTPSSQSAASKLYKMKVYSYKGSSRQRVPSLIVSESGQAATVHQGDTLRVDFKFETLLHFGLSVEQCWLSSRSDGDGSDTHWLVSDGCPAPSGTASMTSGSGFEFAVTKQHLAMRQLYIFCVVGICKTEGRVTQSLGMCLRPEDRCGGARPKRVAVQGQVKIHRGPLQVAPAKYTAGGGVGDNEVFPAAVEDFERPQDWEIDGVSDGSSPLGAAAGGRPPTHNYVMVGVSAEIAIAIAIASFVMGAALTGTLCYFLQFRKISAKMVRSSRLGGIGGGGDCSPGSGMDAVDMPLMTSPSPTVVTAPSRATEKGAAGAAAATELAT